jgi:branched-chain amino acid transport system permease protein
MARRPSNAALALLALAILPPAVLPPYWLHVLIIGLFYAIMASSWNLLAGYTGQVSFAHAAFAGTGAYVSGMLAVHAHLTPWLGVPLAVAACAALGFALGKLCLRMGGIYLSLTTLGFSELLRLVLTNEERWTRGTMGLQVPGMFAEYSKPRAYWLFALAMGATWLVVKTIVDSDRGLAFRAVLNDETAAAACGVDTASTRAFAFTVSGALAGLAGALYGHYLMLITPDIASLGQMFLVLAMTAIGGLGTTAGPVVGALLIEGLSEKIRVYGQYHLLIFGLITLLMARFAPEGLVGLYKRKR